MLLLLLLAACPRSLSPCCVTCWPARLLTRPCVVRLQACRRRLQHLAAPPSVHPACPHHRLLPAQLLCWTALLPGAAWSSLPAGCCWGAAAAACSAPASLCLVRSCRHACCWCRCPQLRSGPQWVWSPVSWAAGPPLGSSTAPCLAQHAGRQAVSWPAYHEERVLHQQGCTKQVNTAA